MIKQLAFICVSLFFTAVYAQPDSSTLSKDNIGCILSPQGNYLHLSGMPGDMADVYLMSGLCSTVAGNIESAAGLPSLKDEVIVKVKDSYYALPVRLVYNNATPTACIVPEGNHERMILGFDVPDENGTIQYYYMLLDIAPQGKLYCFEVESQTPLNEDRIIMKYDIAGIVGVLPVAEKINLK